MNIVNPLHHIVSKLLPLYGRCSDSMDPKSGSTSQLVVAWWHNSSGYVRMMVLFVRRGLSVFVRHDRVFLYICILYRKQNSTTMGCDVWRPSPKASKANFPPSFTPQFLLLLFPPHSHFTFLLIPSVPSLHRLPCFPFTSSPLTSLRNRVPSIQLGCLVDS